MFFRRKKFLFSLIAFVILVIFQRITPQEQVLSQKIIPSQITPTTQVEQSVKEEVSVTKVVDGDTVEVLLNGKKEKVRVIGINTPETVDPRRPVQCFGKEASNFAKQTLTGENVTLESDPTQSNRDKYGRLLRYIFLSDIDFGKQMIEQGYAHEYTYDIPYKYQSAYQAAERQAREGKKGLWSNSACPQGTS